MRGRAAFLVPAWGHAYIRTPQLFLLWCYWNSHGHYRGSLRSYAKDVQELVGGSLQRAYMALHRMSEEGFIKVKGHRGRYQVSLQPEVNLRRWAQERGAYPKRSYLEVDTRVFRLSLLEQRALLSLPVQSVSPKTPTARAYTAKVVGRRYLGTITAWRNVLRKRGLLKTVPVYRLVRPHQGSYRLGQKAPEDLPEGCFYVPMLGILKREPDVVIIFPKLIKPHPGDKRGNLTYLRKLDYLKGSNGSPHNLNRVTGKGLDVNGNSLEVNGNSLEVTSKGLESNGRGLDVNGRSLDVNGRSLEVNVSSTSLEVASKLPEVSRTWPEVRGIVPESRPANTAQFYRWVRTQHLHNLLSKLESIEAQWNRSPQFRARWKFRSGREGFLSDLRRLRGIVRRAQQLGVEKVDFTCILLAVPQGRYMTCPSEGWQAASVSLDRRMGEAIDQLKRLPSTSLN